MASGRPVVAYRGGGALETVKEGETGAFFNQPSSDCLASVLATFEDGYDPAALRRHALRFDKEAFKERLFEVISRRFDEHLARLG
jgi:glycosyltransferase involved in cell wall biosynthesis